MSLPDEIFAAKEKLKELETEHSAAGFRLRTARTAVRAAVPPSTS